MPGSRPGSAALIWSQFRSPSPAVAASTAPNTCGWRRISFWRTCSATSANVPAPRSSSSSDRKWTWNSTSPSSSSSLASSPEWAASASSYASSTVCGTIERSSCSRSQGHSRRSLRVTSSSRSSAAERSLTALGLLRGLRCWRRRGLRGGLLPARVAAGGGAGFGLVLRSVLALGHAVIVRAVGLVLVVLAEGLDELVERLLLALGAQQVLDRLLGLVERLLRGLRDLLDLEDVPAELGLDGTLELALLGLEDRRVEGLLLLSLRHGREQAGLGLRSLVDRVLLHHLLEGLPGRERLLGPVCLGLGLGQHHAQVTALRLGEALLVLLVVR